MYSLLNILLVATVGLMAGLIGYTFYGMKERSRQKRAQTDAGDEASRILSSAEKEAENLRTTAVLNGKEELLELLKKYAYQEGDFTLSSGKKSKHYVNCKPVTLSGRGLTLASLLMLKEVDTKVVGGLTLGADPLVSGISLVSALDSRMVNGLIVRKEAKGHGTQAWIEGLLPPE